LERLHQEALQILLLAFWLLFDSVTELRKSSRALQQLVIRLGAATFVGIVHVVFAEFVALLHATVLRYQLSGLRSGDAIEKRTCARAYHLKKELANTLLLYRLKETVLEFVEQAFGEFQDCLDIVEHRVQVVQWYGIGVVFRQWLEVELHCTQQRLIRAHSTSLCYTPATLATPNTTACYARTYSNQNTQISKILGFGRDQLEHCALALEERFIVKLFANLHVWLVGWLVGWYRTYKHTFMTYKRLGKRWRQVQCLVVHSYECIDNFGLCQTSDSLNDTLQCLEQLCNHSAHTLVIRGDCTNNHRKQQALVRKHNTSYGGKQRTYLSTSSGASCTCSCSSASLRIKQTTAST
jgi:hypothetical protein